MSKVQLFLEDFEKTYTDARGNITDDENKIDRAIIILKGKQSSEATKLAKELYEIKKKEKELTELKKKCEARSREMCETLSEASDIVLTRVMETASATITIARASERKNIKWDDAFGEILELVGKKLKPKLEEVVQKYTSSTSITPKVSVSLKDEGFGDWVGKVGDVLKNFINGIRNWGNSYKQELDQLTKKYI